MDPWGPRTPYREPLLKTMGENIKHDYLLTALHSVKDQKRHVKISLLRIH